MLYQIIKIAINATYLYDAILATGIFVHISLQIIINICVATSLFPNTGLPLPLMSYGGSSTLISFVELGICVSISKKSVLKCYHKLELEKKEHMRKIVIILQIMIVGLFIVALILVKYDNSLRTGLLEIAILFSVITTFIGGIFDDKK